MTIIYLYTAPDMTLMTVILGLSGLPCSLHRLGFRGLRVWGVGFEACGRYRRIFDRGCWMKMLREGLGARLIS